jgi:hypothetical protein
MDALTRGSAFEWGHMANPSAKRSFGPLKIGRLLLGGGLPILDLRLIEINRDGVFLTFPEGATPAENAVFNVVRPLGRREDPVLASGQPRRIVAEVRVVKAVKGTRTLVQVLWGSVIGGVGAERGIARVRTVR